MKNIVGIVVGLGTLALFIYVGYFLYQKNQEDPIVYETTSPFKETIIKKTVATGSINPRKEIMIKPQISGIIDKIYVEAGEYIKKGELVARIKIIPDDLNLSNAQTNVAKAKIAVEESRIEKERREKLFTAKAISETEYNQFLYQFKQRLADLEQAENNLQLIKDGVSKAQTQSTTLVRATNSGMVLDVPVKEGEQVIQSNNFNDGTTIASVADMTDLIFEGNVDESEVGKIKEKMNLLIKIGAIEGKSYNALLEYISPKGEDDQGTIQFEIRAAMKQQEGETTDFIRAGYSANADIILQQADSVVAIKERDLLFDEDTKDPYVEIETGEQEFERRDIKTGLSDGINVQILDGLVLEDKYKKQN